VPRSPTALRSAATQPGTFCSPFWCGRAVVRESHRAVAVVPQDGPAGVISLNHRRNRGGSGSDLLREKLASAVPVPDRPTHTPRQHWASSRPWARRRVLDARYACLLRRGWLSGGSKYMNKVTQQCLRICSPHGIFRRRRGYRDGVVNAAIVWCEVRDTGIAAPSETPRPMQ